MRLTTLASYCVLALSMNSGSVAANSLMDVYELALANDPTIMAAQYQRNAAEAALSLAKSSRMPTLGATFDGSLSGIHNSNNTHEEAITTALQARLSIYNRGNDLGVARGRTQLKQSDADLANMKQDLISRTASGYFGILRAQDNVAFAKSEREAIYRQLDQAERRYDVGLVAITDVKEAQASYDSAVANVIAAENQLRAAIESLRVMTNSYATDLHFLKEDVELAPPKPNDPELWVATAKKKSPIILAAQESLEDARLATKLAASGRYPSLDLIAFYQDKSADLDIRGLSDSSNDSESHEIKIQLTVPLYTGGAVSASKNQARALERSSEKILDRTERDVERNVRNAFSTVEARISQVKALKRALESNEVRLEATEAGYDAGTRTAVDVLNAIRGKTNAAAQYAGARYDYILAMLDLQAAVGLLNKADVARFDAWLEAPDETK